MNILRNFSLFWYDFIVGDAWELAAGVVIALVLSAALASTVWQNMTWLLLPFIIGLSLVASLAWYAWKQQS